MRKGPRPHSVCSCDDLRGEPMTGTTLDDYTDRYAQRMRGMAASEIRALFAVASRPEVVSLAGGMPYVAALPLDAIAELTAKAIREQGAVALQYGFGQGDPRLRELICEVMALGGHRRVRRRHRRDRRLAAGARPDRPDLPRPGRRRARRGADLRGRARHVRRRPGRRGPRCDGRRRTPARGAARGARTAPCRGSPGQVPLHRAELPEPGRRHAHRIPPRRDHRHRRASTTCSSSRTTRTACSASRTLRGVPCALARRSA